MEDNFEIVYAEKPDWDAIGQGINAFNLEQAGPENGESLCFLLRDPGKQVVGGLIGSTYWNWFHIDLMWIRADLRGRGLGRQILMRAEDLARSRGAQFAHLDTFTFQAPDFYKKFGYRVFGELKDCPPGFTRFYMTKEL